MQYKLFYYQYGIRRPDQLIHPPLPTLKLLSLPKDSIFHYMGVGPLDDGPTDQENALKNIRKPMFIATVGDLTRHEGNPRKLPLLVDRLARNHRVKNPKFIPMKDLAVSQRDPNVPIVYNYAYLHRLYKYQKNYYTNYNRWENFFATLWTKVAEVAVVSDRQQFIEFDLPRVLPAFSSLKGAELTISQKTAAIFSNSESVALLEVFKWLGEHRATSSMNAIRKEDYRKINLIFKESDRWYVMNLGTVETWRGPTKEEIKADPNKAAEGVKGFAPQALQKRFMRLQMSLFEARTNDLPMNLGTEEDPAKVVVAPSSEPEVKLTPVEKAPKPIAPVLNPVAGPTPKTGVEPKPIDASPVVLAEKALREEDDDELLEDPDELRDDDILHHDVVEPDVSAQEPQDPHYRHDEHMEEIDKDLEHLEVIAAKAQSDPNDEEVGNFEIVVPQERTLETALVSAANALADVGGLSATEYRRYIEAAGNYKKILAPDGRLMDDFITIKPHEVVIDKPAQIPDKPTIVDKTMLSSSLFDFDSRYVREVMQRDVAHAVMSLQNAGVLVTDFRAHDVENITGAHTEYIVKVKPLQGTPSTLRFKMPKVQPNGSFKISGTNYRTRKQRGDMPIRKLSPTRVALTSYYGKLFCERSPKKVNDYGRWLRDKIMSLGLSDLPTSPVSEMIPGESFDPALPTPRLYSMIAMGFRGFTLKTPTEELKLNFDVRNLSSLDPQWKERWEKDRFLVVGKNSQNHSLFMGEEGVLYVESTPGKMTPLPGLEELLGIRDARAPIEYAELRVFGKMIPVGIILGYLLGLENLIKILKVTPRVVAGGQRTSITTDEWAIVFEDETWIFSRDEPIANLVLAGWRDFDVTTKNYSSHEFNKKDVYFNVLEDHKLSVRYLREMDLMNQMFIDPICKELLIEMGEPVLFTELLVRACEMLSTDQHPHELDARFMRVKGYERFSGLLYSELVKSLRVHNAKVSKSTQPLEMNPYAVWIAISEDPAKDQALEINPIKEMKEIEAVTYSGTGGRSGRSMVKRTRAFHPTDMGIISEATSDSSDVGINTFLSADPQFKSLRGTAKPYVVGQTGQTAALSTSSLVSVAADRDD